MDRIFKISFLLVFSIFGLISCNEDDAASATPPEPFAIQYPKDLAKIDAYLDTHHMEVSPDNDVTFLEIPAGNTTMQSIRTQTLYPLMSKNVDIEGVSHKIYYISLNEGTQENPTKVDSIFVDYKGDYISGTSQEIPNTDTTVTKKYRKNINFDSSQSPVWFTINTLIGGFSEILPFFKTGTSSLNSDGTVTYNNFGAGVMFLPSALGYYSQPTSTIPTYSPLIFSFKLKSVNYVDNDFDRIDSRYEDLNGDGNYLNDDTDGDGRYNFLDQDDDGDGITTKNEIRKPIPYQGRSAYYPFNPILDNPLTTSIDESEPKGIPDASGNGILSTRLRRHLDSSAKPPYTTY
jgi:FKBP-type peptidyl-prolyl cis-trans isomerase FkpA